MASVNREKREALVRKADALRTDWLMAREEHLAEQLAANVEVRRVWIDSDPVRVGQSQEDQSPTLMSKRLFEKSWERTRPRVQARYEDPFSSQKPLVTSLAREGACVPIKNATFPNSF